MDHPHRPRLALTAALGLGLAVVGAVTACGGTPASGAPTGAITVVAGENFWGDIASQIGGATSQVTSIISDPNADPHNYETDPHDAAAVARRSRHRERRRLRRLHGQDARTASELHRDVLIRRSSRSASRAATRTRTSGTTRHVTPRPRGHRGAAGADDPADAATFQANLADVPRRLPAVRRHARHRSGRSTPARRSPTPSGCPGYLVDAPGCASARRRRSPRPIEDGNDPSPADTAAFDAAISHRREGAALQRAGRRPVDQQDQGAGHGAAGSRSSGSPRRCRRGADFQAWQIAQARALLAALGG